MRSVEISTAKVKLMLSNIKVEQISREKKISYFLMCL